MHCNAYTMDIFHGIYVSAMTTNRQRENLEHEKVKLEPTTESHQEGHYNLFVPYQVNILLFQFQTKMMII